jgi:hypothetical protein
MGFGSFSLKVILAVFLGFNLPIASALQFQQLVRLSRTTAMGGAGVGLADQEDALFNNAAGLAGMNERRFKLVSTGLEASLDAYGALSNSLSAFSDFSLGTLNEFMGQDINTRVGQTTLVILPGFALAYIVDFQGVLNEYALSNPNFDLGYQTTHGVQMGTGWSFSSGRRPTSEVRFGMAAKILWRRGGFYNIQTSGFLQAASLGKAYLDQLVGSFGLGFGGDVGFQFVNRLDPKTTFSAGLSLTDIGDTRFSDPKASRLQMNLGWGLGYKQKAEFGMVSVAFDLRNLNRAGPLANKTHFGAEVELPALKLSAGLNQLNYTWGAAFDLWVLKISAVSTAEEIGVAKGQNTSRRYMLMVDFNMPI